MNREGEREPLDGGRSLFCVGVSNEKGHCSCYGSLFFLVGFCTLLTDLWSSSFFYTRSFFLLYFLFVSSPRKLDFLDPFEGPFLSSTGFETFFLPDLFICHLSYKVQISFYTCFRVLFLLRPYNRRCRYKKGCLELSGYVTHERYTVRERSEKRRRNFSFLSCTCDLCRYPFPTPSVPSLGIHKIRVEVVVSSHSKAVGLLKEYSENEE